MTRLTVDEKYIKLIQDQIKSSFSFSYSEILRQLRDGVIVPGKAASGLIAEKIVAEHVNSALGFHVNSALQGLNKDQYAYAVKQIAGSLKLKYIPNFDVKDIQALKILTNSNVFLTSKYYDNQHSEKLREEFSKIFQDGERIEEISKNILPHINKANGGSAAYAKMLCRTASTNCRSVAQGNAYEKYAVEEYKIWGPDDAATCSVCAFFHDRVFPTKYALKMRDKLLKIDSEKLGYDKAIKKIKKANTWINEKTLNEKYGNLKTQNEKNNLKIVKADPGLALPTYHGGCRCSTVIA